VSARTARSAVAGALAGAIAVGLGTGVPVAAADESPAGETQEQGFVPGVDPLTLDDLGGTPSREDLDRAITRMDPGVATTFELEGAVTSFEYVEVEDEEVVVTLETDVLFDVASADLSEAAVERVREIARELPEGVAASVDGHTDSVGDDAENLDLSQRRAQAVADAAAAERPDVTFEVQGFGESELKVAESGDDVAAARAQNRRVELRYSGTAPGEGGGIEIEEHDVEPVRGEFVPGDGPRVDLVEDAETVAEKTVVVPNDEGREEQVRVAVEPIVVRGSLMRLRVQLTPLDPVDGESDRISVYDLTGKGQLHASAVDPYALVSYTPVRGGGTRLDSDPLYARTVVDRPVRYEVYLPRPVDESIESLYVNVVPTWPTFEDVPVVWD
jgi:outer membrane protein OmpA-like peptidoglycan-associated protein